MNVTYYTEEYTRRRNAASALKRMQKLEKRFKNKMITKRLKNGTILSARTQDGIEDLEGLYE